MKRYAMAASLNVFVIRHPHCDDEFSTPDTDRMVKKYTTKHSVASIKRFQRNGLMTRSSVSISSHPFCFGRSLMY